MKRFIVNMVNKALAPLGARLIRIKNKKIWDFENIYVQDLPKNKIIHLNKISGLSDNIRGMINARAGEELFSLAYMQALKGDVIEVGSFQGKSTFFLGQAVQKSGNGRLYAIDHFQGNKGKEYLYKIDREDLSDLEFSFQKNIDIAGLKDIVTLINKPNYEAVDEIDSNSIRLLYIDGDHTAEGVVKDLRLFYQKLKDGAIIVFDDYDNSEFGGLVSATNKFICEKKITRKYLIDRTLVIEIEK